MRRTIALLICTVLALVAIVAAGLPARAAAPASRWVSQCIECPKDIDLWNGGLKLDAAGHEHVAYGGDRLYYAWHDGTSWHQETADWTPLTGLYASLALDAAGQPHISLYDDATGYLRHVYHTAAGWQDEFVDEGEIGGDYSSLALDAAGNPHIVYEGSSGLKYACKSGDTWTIEPIDAVTYGQYPSLALDGSGMPHVAYVDGWTSQVSYAFRDADSQTWQVEAIAEGGEPSLALAADGTAYVGLTGAGVQVARRDGVSQTWHVEQVASGWDFGVSLALDPAGRPRLAYDDFKTWDLLYAFYFEADYDFYLPLVGKLRR